MGTRGAPAIDLLDLLDLLGFAAGTQLARSIPLSTLDYADYVLAPEDSPERPKDGSREMCALAGDRRGRAEESTDKRADRTAQACCSVQRAASTRSGV